MEWLKGNQKRSKRRKRLREMQMCQQLSPKDPLLVIMIFSHKSSNKESANLLDSPGKYSTSRQLLRAVISQNRLIEGETNCQKKWSRPQLRFWRNRSGEFKAGLASSKRSMLKKKRRSTKPIKKTKKVCYPQAHLLRMKSRTTSLTSKESRKRSRPPTTSMAACWTGAEASTAEILIQSQIADNFSKRNFKN